MTSSETIVLEGGTVVTAYGVREADVWIEAGKVRRVSQNALDIARGAAGVDRFDARGYFVLPGWVSLTRLHAGAMETSEQYRERVRALLQQGVTSLVDTVDWDERMRPEEIWYQLTPHYDDPVDYGVRLRIPCAAFTPKRVRQLREWGFRLLDVTVTSLSELAHIPWRALYPQLTQGKIAVHLHVPADQVEPHTQKELAQAWVRHCIYGKVRTCVPALDPLSGHHDAFYGVISLEGGQLARVLHHLRRHWYGYLPVVYSVDQDTAALSPREWDPATLLCLLVRIMSTNVAKAVGTYPGKGSLLPGADADLVLLDKGEWLTKFDISSILKISEMCQPAYVMSKGKWLYRRGVFTFATGSGTHIRDLQPYNYAM